MNSLTLSRKWAFGLLGLWIMGSVGMPALADECAITDADSLKKCKDKKIKVSGPREDMFEVPEYFMGFDPSMKGEEGRQDYMKIAGEQVIIHTTEEVQCPEKLEVEGTLKQEKAEDNQVWIIKVDKFKCL